MYLNQHKVLRFEWNTTSFFFVALALITCIRLLISRSIELHFDEAYYWHWANHIQLSYYDHPPMVAWLIWGGTSLFGDNELGVRFFGLAITAIASWMLFDAALRLYGPKEACFSGLGFHATLLIGVGGILMTPDAPLMFFSVSLLWGLVRFCISQNPFWWIFIGFMGGAALLSKYTAVLLFASVGLWLLIRPDMRNWLLTFWPWIAVAISALCFLPVIIWNYQNDWASFYKQGGRLLFEGTMRPEYVLEFLGGQLGVITPVLCVLLTIGIWKSLSNMGSSGNKTEALFAILFVAPAIFFLLLSPFIRVQANWPAFIWPAAIMATTGMLSSPQCSTRIHRLTDWALACGTVLVFAVWTYMLVPKRVCLPKDPTNHFVGHQGFADAVISFAKKGNATHIVTPDYATASWVRFYGDNTIPIIHVTNRPRYVGFSSSNNTSGSAVILSKRDKVVPEIQTRYSTIGHSETIARAFRGCTIKNYYVRYAK